MSFLVVCRLKRKPGSPISALCPRLLNMGCWGGDQRALACPEAHKDKQGHCALQGPGAPGRGVFPVFSVTWMFAHYLIIFRWEMWQAGESWPLLSTSTAEKGLCLMVLLVIWAGAQEQRKRGKKQTNLPAPDWVTWHRRSKWYELEFINNRVISPVWVDTTVKHVLLSRTRKCFLSHKKKKKKTLPYSLLLLLSVAVVGRGGKGIANSLSNVQRGNHEECFLSEVWIVRN